MSNEQLAPAIPKEIYATLTGMIDAPKTQRLIDTLNTAVTQRVETVHLAIHSAGGMISDGIAAYNYLRAIPINLIAYNFGMVSSIAVILFLAARERKVSALASFMIHKAHNSPVAATAVRMAQIADGLAADDRRIESILRSHLSLTEEQWSLHERTELLLDAEAALGCGLVHSVADWKVPSSAILLTF